MSSDVIAVWEPASYWTPELQRELHPLGFQILACRTADESVARLSEGAGQAVIVCQETERLSLSFFPGWVSLGIHLHVILTVRDEPLRWFLSELGVYSVFDFHESRRYLVATCLDVSRRVRQFPIGS